MPRVATIVLNYRAPDDTLACVRALRASTVLDQRLIVVDNDVDGPEHRALAASLGDNVTVMATGDNLGYAAGNNVGIRLALEDRPDFVFVVNPDVEVLPRTLEGLLAAAEEVPDAGVVGGRIVAGDDPHKILYDGGIVDEERWGTTSHLRMGKRVEDHPPGPVADTAYVTGAGMLVRRPVLRRVGLIPEDYFLYFEETDFCLRVQRAGWRTVVDPRVVMLHHKRSSGALPTPYYLYYMTRNRLHFAARHFGGNPAAVLDDWREVFLHPWRDRVRQRAPHWVPVFDEIVALAVGDAAAGVVGRRRDVEDFPAPGDTPTAGAAGLPAAAAPTVSAERP